MFQLIKIITKSFLIGFLFFSFQGISQTSDQKMAIYYFEEGDFEKAKMYYVKVFETNQSRNTYSNYFTTLIELKEYKEAEKITKKIIKKNPNYPYYNLKLGEIYEIKGEQKKADKHYQKIIDKLNSKTPTYVFSLLSNEFQNVNKLDFAIKAIEKGEENNTNNVYRFALTKALIYGKQNKTELMIDKYLSVLNTNSKQVNQIKNYLANSIDFENDSKKVKILRTKLLRIAQKNPENESFSDLLIWMYQLKGDYDLAFIQIKAKDKRMKVNGEKIYSFANQCFTQKKYDLAIKAYEYLIQAETTTKFYRKKSKYFVLNALKQKITQNHHYTKADLLNLNSKYTTTLSQIETPEDKIPLLQDLANLQGFYLHNIDTAEIILKTILTTPGLTKRQKANNKTILGDILMLKNKVWDASLLYMQVEKEFKQDIVGSLAKFKNAKLYYYTGDFEWSQNQLDALKASTSKLISNDAIELSLLITDNYNMDTTPIHMQRFAQADLYIFQNNFEKANLKLDSINQEAPDHTLSDEILYRRYTIAYKKQDFESAKTFLNKIIELYPEDILADNALYNLAQLEENQLNNKKNALVLYEKLLFDYPGSLFVVDARKRYRELKGTNSEVKSIGKYLK